MLSKMVNVKDGRVRLRAWVRISFLLLVGLAIAGTVKTCASTHEALTAEPVHPLIAPGDLHAQSSQAEPSVGLNWFFNVDPTASSGVSAPQWQFGVRTDSPSLYYKSGTANTAWTKIGTGTGGGGGTVTGITCGTNMTCTPSNPITTSGTISAAGSVSSITCGDGVQCTPSNPITGTGTISSQGYSGTEYSFFNDWLTSYVAGVSGWYISQLEQVVFSGTGAQCVAIASTQRPGILECSTGTTTTGTAGISGSLSSFDFGAYTDVHDRVVLGLPTLSNGTDEYKVFAGLNDGNIGNVGTQNPMTDGCFWLYDRANGQSGNVNPSNLNNWEAWCCSNTTCTGVILDGSTHGGISTCNAQVIAEVLPNTGINNLLVDVTALGTSAAFTFNGTLCATITTNIPTGSARVTGENVFLRKSAGTSARVFDLDATTLAYTLAAARSP